MPTIRVRVSAECAARFDLAAAACGGRSALLRRLIAEASEVPVPAQDTKGAPRTARMMVRLAPEEAVFVAEEARAMGLSQTAWVAGLVRLRARLGVRFSREGELALIATHSELRRISVDVNQIARAASARGRVLDGDLSELAALGAEIRRHMFGLRRVFEADFAYWEAGA